MQEYKSSSHTVWDCKYHIVWTTKYRYPVLKGDVGLRCRELLREIAMSKEMIIYAGAINRDHVHMLIGIPPSLSVSKAVQYLKGKSSHKLLSEYKQLRKRYWGNICGREGTGWRQAEMWLMKYGWSTSRTNGRRNLTMSSEWCEGPTAFRLNDRLAAVIWSHRLLAGGDFYKKDNENMYHCI